MTANTKIEWADHTFNPWEGCQKVGPGCDHCYAETRNKRFGGGVAVNWGPGAPRRRTSASNWQQPLKWNAQAEREGRRYRVFCASLADVFDNEAPPEWRVDLFRLIEATPCLDWLLLTKRVGNARSMSQHAMGMIGVIHKALPPNVWLGATVVNQEEADRDIPKLLAVPARVRFLSIEPMLGPIDLLATGDTLCRCEGCMSMARKHPETPGLQRIDWVICGGESGPGARPMHPDWARSLRDQCAAAGVPFLFKQWGEWWEVDSDGRDDETGDHHVVDVPGIEADERFDPKTDCLIARDGRVFRTLDELPADTPARHMTRLGKKAAGRLLDGVQHDGLPSTRP